MASVFSWATANAADALTWSTALSGLASGAYSLSSEIDNSTGLFVNGVLQFVSSAATGSNVSGLGVISATVLYAPDGSTYPAPGATGVATGVPPIAYVPGLLGAAFQNGHSNPFRLLPFKMKILIQNNLGISLPSGTVTLNLTRFNPRAN